MPVIGAFNTFTDGNTAAADPVMQNFYYPLTAPASMEAIDGWLDDLNLASGASAWQVRRDQIRPRGMTRAGMVGLTGHADYLNTFGIDGEEFKAVPGASISFYLPRAPEAVILQWQFLSASDEKYGPAGDPTFQHRLYVDGAAIAGQVRYCAPAAYTSGADTLRLPRRDRIWSGHASFLAGTNGLAAGWHQASIRVYKGYSADSAQGRARIRNMKYIALF
jgi:hypothetical protein